MGPGAPTAEQAPAPAREALKPPQAEPLAPVDKKGPNAANFFKKMKAAATLQWLRDKKPIPEDPSVQPLQPDQIKASLSADTNNIRVDNLTGMPVTGELGPRKPTVIGAEPALLDSIQAFLNDNNNQIDHTKDGVDAANSADTWLRQNQKDTIIPSPDQQMAIDQAANIANGADLEARRQALVNAGKDQVSATSSIEQTTPSPTEQPAAPRESMMARAKKAIDTITTRVQATRSNWSEKRKAAHDAQQAAYAKNADYFNFFRDRAAQLQSETGPQKPQVTPDTAPLSPNMRGTPDAPGDFAARQKADLENWKKMGGATSGAVETPVTTPPLATEQATPSPEATAVTPPVQNESTSPTVSSSTEAPVPPAAETTTPPVAAEAQAAQPTATVATEAQSATPPAEQQAQLTEVARVAQTLGQLEASLPEGSEARQTIAQVRTALENSGATTEQSLQEAAANEPDPEKKKKLNLLVALLKGLAAVAAIAVAAPVVSGAAIAAGGIAVATRGDGH